MTTAAESKSGRERATAIIPARLGSTRFPGKVLADRTGRPLIQHVCEAAARARCVERVVVATDSERVAEAVRCFGGVAVMTDESHTSGTSRLAEAAAALGLSPESVVVNVQGDEPELEPDLIDAAAGALIMGAAPMATAAVPFSPGEDPGDRNLVKVVLREDGSAMYFSRSVIPHGARGESGTRPLRHVGVYAYRRAFLDTYISLSPTGPELTESLEQLRVLGHGYAIAVAVREARGAHGIDTPEQYEAFVRRWRGASGGR